MNTEASEQPAPKGGNPFVIFIISLCAANLFELGGIFVYAASAANALLTLWFAVWTFVRSWHVEQRLRAGLEVDEPKVSIIANLRS
jgi:hypothetical protein